jgi:hypothetical protein
MAIGPLRPRSVVIAAFLGLTIAIYLAVALPPLGSVDPGVVESQLEPEAPPVPSVPLHDLRDACGLGDMDACIDLFQRSPLGSVHEEFALSHIEQESTVSDAALKAYERLLREQLEPGVIVYTTPERMQTGQSTTVTARITRDKLDSLSDEIYEGLEEVGEGSLETATLEVGTTMRATLQGEGFSVRLVGPEEQRMRVTGHREWEWEVEATRPGTWPLYLTVYATYDGEDIHHEVLKREIVVTVDPIEAVRGFTSRNWQWLIAFLFGSGAGGPALLRWWRRRTSRGEGDQPNDAGKEEVGAP